MEPVFAVCENRGMRTRLGLVFTALSLLTLGARSHTVERAATPAPPPPAASAAPAPTEVAPDPPAKNLKVLPREWTRRQVIDRVMKNWTADLGVRCQHCHVGEESKPSSEWDFPSDEKPTKLRAREMLQMLQEINRRLGEMQNLHGTSSIQATCYTCHRGMPRPRRIEEVFDETLAAKGIDSAIAQYGELRAQSLSIGGYDFSVKPLVRLARTRVAEKDTAGARKLMELALGLGFDVLATRSVLAEIALAEGDRETALEHLRKALALTRNPAEKEFVEEQLKDAMAAPEPPRN